MMSDMPRKIVIRECWGCPYHLDGDYCVAPQLNEKVYVGHLLGIPSFCPLPIDKESETKMKEAAEPKEKIKVEVR